MNPNPALFRDEIGLEAFVISVLIAFVVSRFLRTRRKAKQDASSAGPRTARERGLLVMGSILAAVLVIAVLRALLG